MSYSAYTIALIKAPTVGRGQALDILSLITKAGFRIMALEHKTLCHETVKAFYHEHVDRPYFPDLEKSVGEGKPVVALVLSSPDADSIAKWRELMGATKSREAARGTIRYQFGGHVYNGAAMVADNAVHGSDSPKAAAYEYSVLFNGTDWPADPMELFSVKQD